MLRSRGNVLIKCLAALVAMSAALAGCTTSSSSDAAPVATRAAVSTPTASTDFEFEEELVARIEVCLEVFNLAVHDVAWFDVEVYALEIRTARESWLRHCAPYSSREKTAQVCELVAAELPTGSHTHELYEQYADRVHGEHC